MKIHAIVAASFLAFGAGPLAAEPLRPMFGGALAPGEVNAIVRSMGLLPTSRPVREGMTYGVLASDPRGRQLRVVIDARFGDVLSVRRAVAAGSPGAYPPGRLYRVTPGHPPGAYAMPWLAPDFRPPAMIGRSDPPAPRPASADKAQQKSPAAPAGANSAVVTVGPSAASRAADPKPTASTKAPSFPPAQSLE